MTTNTKEDYSQKLKDPRWQKKRLYIFERDHWACLQCGSKHNTLVVHHRYYLPNTAPWDYPDEALATLCEECHEAERETWDDVGNILVDAAKWTLWAEDAHYLACMMAGMPPLDPSESESLIILLTWIMKHPEERQLVVDFVCTISTKMKSYFKEP